MNKVKIKNIVLLLLFIFLLLVGYANSITQYLEYLVIMILIIQGVNAIFDYIFRLPMKVGFAKTMYPNEKNIIGRVIMLLIATALMLLAIWWIVFLPL